MDATISQSTQRLIEKCKIWYQSLEKREGQTIHVDEIASRVAAFYERIKGVVDWQEEHLLRKRAIERSLKRVAILDKQNEKIAETLVYEFIRGGHFPNDSIPEYKIEIIQKIIDKYFFILKNAPENPTINSEKDKKIELRNWLLDMASYEIEKTLTSFLKEESLIKFMTICIQKRLKVNEGIIIIKGLTEEEENTQIYIAVQKALLKLDRPTISYNLFERRYPNWTKITQSSIELPEITKNINHIKESIEKDLDHRLGDKFYSLCEKYNTPYLILGDIIADEPMKAQENLEKPGTLEELIKISYAKRLTKLKKRIRRAAIYCTASIFITKMALALAIEIPIDKMLNEFSYPILLINALFPPLLMFLLVITIKPPKKNNLQRVIIEVMKITYKQEKKDVYQIRIPRKRSKILNSIISTFYSFMFLFSFSAIIYVLYNLNFGFFSMFIFLFFLCVISFFGMQLRERSRELTIEEKTDTFFKSLIEFFFLPVIRVGKWLSMQWGNLNIALVISILIDAPFFTLIGFLEQWRYFLKEKKEEIH